MIDPDQEYSEAEAAQRRDKVLSVMLHTPPQPHAAKAKSRVGKSKAPSSSTDRREKSAPAS